MKPALMFACLACLVLIASAAYWLWTPDRPRAELEARYFMPGCRYLTVAGVRLYLCDSGPRSAPALILLHGFGSSLQTWDAWAKALEADHRVIRFDLPGSGLTGADPTGDYRDSRSIEVLDALMRALDVDRASLIGNSIGGRIAWTFAALEPTRVDKLVLVSPDGFASPGFEYGKAPEVPAVMNLMRYVLPRPLVRMNLVPAYADPSALSEATLTRYYDLLLAPGVRTAMIARMRQTILQNPAPLLHRIQAPTLLVWGEQDGMIPHTNAADYMRELPHAKLVTLPGLGHVPQEEAPDAALAAVRAFLSQS